jgi:hypothetical protein
MIFVKIEQCRKENKDWAQETFEQGSYMLVGGKILIIAYLMQIQNL